MASFINYPSTYVLFILSEPAKSTKCNRDTVFTSDPAFYDSIYIINMQWDLVDASFLGVSATTLLVSPVKN